jgi:hypothetical protein
LALQLGERLIVSSERRQLVRRDLAGASNVLSGTAD